MHICFIISVPFPPEEGIGNYVYNLSKKIIEKGHKATVITRGSLLETQRDVIDGIDVIKAPFIAFYPFYIHMHGIYVNRILKRLESEIDIVHAHTPLIPPLNTSLPIITTVHTPMLTDTASIEVTNLRSIIERLMGRFVSFSIESKLLKKSDEITVVANSVMQELEHYDVDTSEVIVIGNGVNEKEFIPIPKKTEKKYILFTGRLAYRKGLFDLIECGKYICEKYPDVFFIISGKGNLLDKLKSDLRKIGLQDKFKFLGYVEHEKLIQLYQNATIYVLPSHYEGLPTVLLEAMSCGVPVVATAVSGNLDVISPGKNGILIPPKCPKKMAEAISILLSDDKLRDELGKEARKTIETRYTWDLISDNIIKCYKSILETKR